ncbi:MAG TPA: chloride channel protein [Gemmatimonadaceae bacterium]|nr:chloride channel protein [Gemmatimonadaceae bacterium]
MKLKSDLGHGSRAEGSLPIAAGLAPEIENVDDEDESPDGDAVRAPRDYEMLGRRTLFISALSLAIGAAGAIVAQVFVSLIGLATNLAYYGRISTAFVDPAGGHRGPLAMLIIPVIGGLIVGLMARYGSSAIRGHGIPEVMQRVLYGESRIPARVTILKPTSAAVAIGTGGPFGAEGPIIATGGALGSLVGQHLHVTADERKTLLAAGAAAGMAATFGSPVSAVLLAIELLLFEYRPRSIIPVALASAVAASIRVAVVGSAPVFPIAELSQPTGSALAFYAVLGAVIGLAAVGINRITYGIEDVFETLGERFHIHWMWWPAIGALVVGALGIVEPRILGVGYPNIIGALSGSIVGRALIVIVVLKFIAWAVYLGSGTSGGILAPLFTFGSGLGAWLGALAMAAAPGLGIDPRIAGLVGMAAIFAGATHALLTAIVFAFETTRQPVGLLPILLGCAAAYLVSLLASRYSLLTEKLARREGSVRTEYSVDHLAHVLVRQAATQEVVSIRAGQTVADARRWLRAETTGNGGPSTHQGFPVLDEESLLIGVVTRREILDPANSDDNRVGDVVKRPPAVVYDDSTLRDAADHMVLEGVGRLPVVSRENPRLVVGIISRSDLLAAHAPRLSAAHDAKVTAKWR